MKGWQISKCDAGRTRNLHEKRLLLSLMHNHPVPQSHQGPDLDFLGASGPGTGAGWPLPRGDRLLPAPGQQLSPHPPLTLDPGRLSGKNGHCMIFSLSQSLTVKL